MTEAAARVWKVHKPLTPETIETLAVAAAKLYNDLGYRTPELYEALKTYFNYEEE